MPPPRSCIEPSRLRSPLLFASGRSATKCLSTTVESGPPQDLLSRVLPQSIRHRVAGPECSHPPCPPCCPSLHHRSPSLGGSPPLLFGAIVGVLHAVAELPCRCTVGHYCKKKLKPQLAGVDQGDGQSPSRNPASKEEDSHCLISLRLGARVLWLFRRRAAALDWCSSVAAESCQSLPRRCRNLSCSAGALPYLLSWCLPHRLGFRNFTL